MKRIIPFSFLFFSSIIVLGQYDSTFVVQNLIKETKIISCYFGESEDIQYRVPKYSDSLVHCTTHQLYKTDKRGLYYLKYYNQEGNIHSEGPAYKDSHRVKFLGRRLVSYPRVGKWKEYDYESNEIVYFNCHYELNDGCQVILAIEIKREKISN